MTTARLCSPVMRAARASMPRVSSMVRNAYTPSRRAPSAVRMPGTSGMNAREPVAMISVSYGVTEPSEPITALANRSMRVIATPACRVTPCSSYQSSALR